VLLGLGRSEPAGAEHRELGHGGLLYHAPAELRTGTELRTRMAQLAQLQLVRGVHRLLRRSRHARLDASQQALGGRARLPARRHLEAGRLAAEEVVQPARPAAPHLLSRAPRKASKYLAHVACLPLLTSSAASA
jgi:hypothetical protein